MAHSNDTSSSASFDNDEGACSELAALLTVAKHARRASTKGAGDDVFSALLAPPPSASAATTAAQAPPAADSWAAAAAAAAAGGGEDAASAAAAAAALAAGGSDLLTPLASAEVRAELAHLPTLLLQQLGPLGASGLGGAPPLAPSFTLEDRGTAAEASAAAAAGAIDLAGLADELRAQLHGGAPARSAAAALEAWRREAAAGREEGVCSASPMLGVPLLPLTPPPPAAPPLGGGPVAAAAAARPGRLTVAAREQLFAAAAAAAALLEQL